MEFRFNLGDKVHDKSNGKNGVVIMRKYQESSDGGGYYYYNRIRVL